MLTSAVKRIKWFIMEEGVILYVNILYTFSYIKLTLLCLKPSLSEQLSCT